MRQWPSFPILVMDLLEAERERRGIPPVEMSLVFNATVDSLPRHRISVIDAPTTRLEAAPLVSLESFGATFEEAERIAYEADLILMGYPVSVSSGGKVVLVDDVGVSSSPVEIDLEDDSPYRRFLATYKLTVRRG